MISTRFLLLEKEKIELKFKHLQTMYLSIQLSPTLNTSVHSVLTHTDHIVNILPSSIFTLSRLQVGSGTTELRAVVQGTDHLRSLPFQHTLSV